MTQVHQLNIQTILLLFFCFICRTDCHDITEIFLKLALNTINQTIKKLLKTQHLSVVLFSVLQYTVFTVRV